VVTSARPPGAEDVTIDSEGVKLRGWLFRGGGRRRGTVIYLHGSADNRASGIYIAERFLARGFDALIYDSRAHGESDGEACTYGYYERKDLKRAIDLAPSMPVVTIGVSLGGAVALQTAAEDRRIATVIAVGTFCDLRTVAIERAPFFSTKADIEAAFRLAEQQAHFRVDDVSPVMSAARIQAPVFLIHGQADKETPSWHSQRVFGALLGQKRLLLVPGAGHNDALRADVWNEIDTWIDKIVPRVASAGERTGKATP
jgi:alpha-beta hydrolase superfamily lysophospholipase